MISKTVRDQFFREDTLKTEDIPNPCNQHLYQCLSGRATNPGKVLPEVTEHIKNLMKSPFENDGKVAKFLKKMEELFPVKEVEAKKAKVTGDKMFASKR